MEASVAVLEEIAHNTAKALERIESSISKLDERFNKRITRLEDRQSADFKWLLGTQIGFATFLFATLAHGFH